MNLSLSLPKLLVTFSLTLAASGTLFADVVTGTFAIGGATADVTATTINFNCTPGLTLAACPASAGNFIVDNTTGDLNPVALEGGFVQDLNEAVTPLNTPNLNIANWLTFSPSPFNSAPSPVSLDLQFLALGVDGQSGCAGPAAPGQICTPIIPALVGSPSDPLGLSNFNLQNTQSGFTASFSVSGTAVSSTGGVSNFTGTFTAVVDGMGSFQDILPEVLAGTAPPFPYTASFSLTAVPEPGYLPMFAGLGIFALAFGLYRKSRLQQGR